MKKFFRSQNLWKIIEEGVVKEDTKAKEEGVEAKVMESEKDDAKALFLLQQALDEIIFP